MGRKKTKKPIPPDPPVAHKRAVDFWKGQFEAARDYFYETREKLVAKNRELEERTKAAFEAHRVIEDRNRQLAELAVRDIDRSLELGDLLSRPPYFLKLESGGRFRITAHGAVRT